MTSVLLLPREDFLYMLDGGRAGLRPPVLCEQWEDQGRHEKVDNIDEIGNWTSFYVHGRPPKRTALALAIDDEPILEGMDLLLRALKGRPKKTYTMEDVERASFAARAEGIGRIVTLNMKGEEEL